MTLSDQALSSERYQLTPRTLIFVTHNDRVLLLKGSPQKRLWANLYNGLGGHIERGEDVLSAARRELSEETGLTDVQLWLCGVITIDSGEDRGVGLFVIRGETETTVICPSIEGVAEWIRFAQIDQAASDLPLMPDLKIFLPRIMASAPGNPPFSAHVRALPGKEPVFTFYS